MSGVIPLTPRLNLRAIYSLDETRQVERPLMRDGLMPWRSGRLECCDCGHAWAGAWEVGAQVQCPQCDSESLTHDD